LKYQDDVTKVRGATVKMIFDTVIVG
jgi:hypothetical protein